MMPIWKSKYKYEYKYKYKYKYKGGCQNILQRRLQQINMSLRNKLENIELRVCMYRAVQNVHLHMCRLKAYRLRYMKL